MKVSTNKFLITLLYNTYMNCNILAERCARDGGGGGGVNHDLTIKIVRRLIIDFVPI